MNQCVDKNTFLNQGTWVLKLQGLSDIIFRAARAKKRELETDHKVCRAQEDVLGSRGKEENRLHGAMPSDT